MGSVVRVTVIGGYSNRYRFYQSASQLASAIQSGLLDAPGGRGGTVGEVRIDLMVMVDTDVTGFTKVAFERAIFELRATAPRKNVYADINYDWKNSRATPPSVQFTKDLKTWRINAIDTIEQASRGLLS